MISIRWRLTLLLGLAIGLLLLVTGLGIFFTLKDVLLTRFDETLTAKAQALITASEIDGGDFEIDLTVKKFAGFGKDGDDYFQIRRRDGSEFLNSPALKKFPESYQEFARFAWPGDESGILKNGHLDGDRSARFYIQPIYPKGDKKDKYQDLYLIVASPLESVNRQVKLLLLVLSVAGAAALLLMIPVIRFVLKRGLKPLDQLSNEVSGIRPHELNHRLDSDKLPRELAPLASSLNSWLGQLENSFERERLFTRHAAHELRTPLAELKVMAELGAMSESVATPDHCREMEKVTDELSELLEKLALLARTDVGNEPVTLETVDLAKSLEPVLARSEEAARKRNLTIRQEITPGNFQTDPTLWLTIVQNLFSNAVSYAPKRTIIDLVASPGVIAMSNLAPNVTEEDLPHFFERFWRKDASHSGYGHSGLGLSIVKSHARLLGGNCQATLSNGKLTLKVVLPAEPPPSQSQGKSGAG